MIILLGGQRSVLGKYQFYVSGDNLLTIMQQTLIS